MIRYLLSVAALISVSDLKAAYCPTSGKFKLRSGDRSLSYMLSVQGSLSGVKVTIRSVREKF